MKKPDCAFCKPQPNGIEPILETENFYITPTLGQIVRVYLLVNTKEHLVSLSQLPDLEHFDELDEIKQTIKRVFQENYGTLPLFFEHGHGDEARGCACTDHAHLHCVPLKQDIRQEVLKYFKEDQILHPDYSFLEQKSRHPGEPYIYYEDKDCNRFIATLTPPYPPTQFMRQVIAISLNKPDKWDWRASNDIDEVKRVADSLREKLFPIRKMSISIAEQDFLKLAEQIRKLPGLIYLGQPFDYQYNKFVYSIGKSTLFMELFPDSVKLEPGSINGKRTDYLHLFLTFASTPEAEKLIRSHFKLDNLLTESEVTREARRRLVTHVTSDRLTSGPLRIQDKDLESRFNLYPSSF